MVVTTFASNAARLQTLGEVAKTTGPRASASPGARSTASCRSRKATGYLKNFPEPVTPDAAMGMPGRDVLVVATGGQGEPRAALGRIAEGTHPIKLAAGDTVIFSSKQIPGNELAIGRIQNQLAAKGVEMVTERQEHVHVSGHPGRPELEAMYRLDQARTAGAGAWRDAPHDGAGAVRAVEGHSARAGADRRRYRPPGAGRARKDRPCRRSAG